MFSKFIKHYPLQDIKMFVKLIKYRCECIRLMNKRMNVFPKVLAIYIYPDIEIYIYFYYGPVI